MNGGGALRPFISYCGSQTSKCMNSLKTVLLLGALSGLLLFGGEVVAGRNGLMTGLVLAIGMNFFSYFFSDKLALMSYSAQPVTPTELPEVYNRVAPVIQGSGCATTTPWMLDRPLDEIVEIAGNWLTIAYAAGLEVSTVDACS